MGRFSDHCLPDSDRQDCYLTTSADLRGERLEAVAQMLAFAGVSIDCPTKPVLGCYQYAVYSAAHDDANEDPSPQQSPDADLNLLDRAADF